MYKILINSDALDHVIYTPLGIPHKGDSLFSQGLYKKYYTEAKSLHPHFQETVTKYEETDSYFTENLNWESEEMNVGDAILLARNYMADFGEKRPYIVNNVMSFCVMSLLENLTMHELRTLRYKESDELLSGFARQKVSRYISKMLSSEINIPSTIDMVPMTMDKIVPTGAFVAKLNVPIKFRN